MLQQSFFMQLELYLHCIFLRHQKTITNNPTLLIFISLCLLGIVNIIWYSHYKVSGSVYTNAYRGPMETGKIALCSAFIFLVLLLKMR